MLVPETISTIRVTMIGLGNIGNNSLISLARMGVRHFTLYDPDTVAAENVYPSGFGIADVGFLKVRVAKQQMQQQLGHYPGDSDIQAREQRYIDQPGETDIVIIGTDTMSSRRTAWEQNQLDWKLWIDGRMGADRCEIYTATRGGDNSYYEHRLTVGESPLACGEKATAPLTTGIIPGLISSIVFQWINGKPIPREYFFSMGDSFFSQRMR